MITPEEIRNKNFTTVRLREGYDQDEVDVFLDRVEVALQAALDASANNAVRVITVAERTAKAAVDEAQREANQLVAAAHHEAAEIVAKSRTEADDERLNIIGRQHAELAILDQTRAELETKIERWKRTDEKYRTWLQGSIDTLRAAMSDPVDVGE